MTRRGVGAAGAVVGLWLAARTVGVPQLHVAAVALLVLLVGCALWILVLPLRLEVTRSVEPPVVAFDGRARVTLRVRNLGSVPSPTAWLEDAWPPELGGGRGFRVPVLAAHRLLDLEAEIVGVHRGRFALGPVVATIRDPFGLVQRRRRLEAPGTLTVYPRVTPLPVGVPLGGASGTVAGGPRRPVGHGEEFADIREYVRGDDLRAVHWASTARRGKLMVRRAEEATAPRATLLLDARHDRHRGSGPDASFEALVSAAASVAHHLGERGRGVTILDRPVVSPPIPRPAASWLPMLAGLQPGPVDLTALLRQVATGSVGEGTLVALLTAPDGEELRALVRVGRGASSRLAVIVDTASFAGVRGTDPDAVRAVAGLRAAGWRATLLREGEPLDRRWQELLGRGRRQAVGGA